jgi:hypothetical protein
VGAPLAVSPAPLPGCQPRRGRLRRRRGIVQIRLYPSRSADAAPFPDHAPTVQQIALEAHGVEPGHVLAGIAVVDRQQRFKSSNFTKPF